MSVRYKVFWAISIIFSVVVIGLSTLILWVGMNNQGLISNDTNGIKPQEEWSNNWPNVVFYEVFVRAYNDSDGDGIGDINGLTEKLDYLQELGIEGIWLMPINPSPSYHQYDVTDYYGIDSDYGTMEDFKHFLEEAHDRNIKVIIDLVVNHTSSEHPWFQAALASKDDPKRDWYIFADKDTKLTERGEWGQQVWHGYRDNKYYGLFWEGMPDLNFDNPEVRAEMINIGTYWLNEIGVDGFRLDAAKHIYKDKEKEKNIVWWQEFRQTMQQVKEDVFLVGEVWTSAAEIAPYMNDGLNSTFNFDLSSKIITSVKDEQDNGLGTFLTRTRKYYATMSKDYVDSIMLTNHDMDRVMSQLQGDVNHAKMAASLLLTLPGNPFIYYGEEIGMQGIKPDEYIREPMRWYIKPEGTSQTTWERSRYNRGANAPTVEAQIDDVDSLYNHYKKLIHLRRSQPALILGEIEQSKIKAPGIVIFERIYEHQSLLVIHNITGEIRNLSLGEESQYNQFLFSSDSSSQVINKENQVEVILSPYSSVILTVEK